ncbi:MAG: Uma2 family endonuclease [Minicystis sp.]
MGPPAEKRTRATYADLEAVPPGKVAEIIDGELHVFPRPAPRHAKASTRLTMALGPFDDDDGDPGGWIILHEPELHFPDPAARSGVDVLDPDIAGWRLEQMPELPSTAYFELAPDWVCEVLSPSTEKHDREHKMPVYAREGVCFAWLIDPIARSFEAYTLGPGRRWGLPTIHRGAERVKVEPFEAIELDLSRLWAK